MNALLNASLGYSAPQSAPPPAPKGNGTGDAVEQHVQKAMHAHKKKDHATAKKHLLNAANLVHRLSQQAPAPSAPPSAPPAVAAA